MANFDDKYDAVAWHVKGEGQHWGTLDVHIQRIDDYLGNEELGSYKRNYPSMYNTFVPFQQRDEDGVVREYALFSDYYDQIAVMRLPSCEIIAREAGGFCPVDFYVPYEEASLPQYNEDGSVHFQYFGIPGNFGFVAGCYWGDDWSWKIQYLDLSRIEEGILTREEKFGYIWIPTSMSLKAAIDMSWYEDVIYEGEDDSNHCVAITSGKHYEL